MAFSCKPARELTANTDLQSVAQLTQPEHAFVLLPINSHPAQRRHRVAERLQPPLTGRHRHQGTPLVVVSDWNSVREHVPLHTLLATTGQLDAAQLSGSRWLPTLPSRWGPHL